MFRELLNRQSQQQQLSTLTSQVTELKEVNETLKKYLEAVMTGVSGDASSRLIASEEKRLEEVKKTEKIRENGWYTHVMARIGKHIPFNVFVDAIKRARTFGDFVETIAPESADSKIRTDLLNTLSDFSQARREFNEIRAVLGVPRIRDTSILKDNAEVTQQDNTEVTQRSTQMGRNRRTN